MRSLTKPWGKFDNTPVSVDNCKWAKRALLKKLNAEDSKDCLYLTVNFLSGAIDIFSDEEGKYLCHLKEGKNCDVPMYLFKRLKSRGYLFPSLEVEDLTYNSVIAWHKHNVALNEKILAFFSLDTECGMGCSYCFQEKNLGRADYFETSKMQLVSVKEAFKALDFFADLKRKKVDWVSGFGGEPLKANLYDVNKLFIDEAKIRKIPVVYFSNLAEIDDALIQLLADNSEYIKYISTTIDGLEEQHNSLRKLPDAFNKTISNVEKLLNLGMTVFVRTNVDANNISCLPEIAQFYDDKGWFELPNFRCMVSRIVDRHHKTEDSLLTEDQAVSSWLRLKDEYPVLRKVYNYEISFVLFNLLRALHLRENIGSIGNLELDNIEVEIEPIISHCAAATGDQFTFTGAPCNAIYPCAACSGLTQFKIGDFSSSISIDKELAKSWGAQDYVTSMRTIDVIKGCSSCLSATFCGGNCLVEAINAHGDASSQSYCNHTIKIIEDFLKREEKRIFYRCKELLNLWQ